MTQDNSFPNQDNPFANKDMIRNQDTVRQRYENQWNIRVVDIFMCVKSSYKRFVIDRDRTIFPYPVSLSYPFTRNIES